MDFFDNGTYGTKRLANNLTEFCPPTPSWDHNGKGRLAASVVTLMVTKVMTSCLDLV